MLHAREQEIIRSGPRNQDKSGDGFGEEALWWSIKRIQTAFKLDQNVRKVAYKIAYNHHVNQAVGLLHSVQIWR